MKKSQHEILSLVREYERKLSEASVPFWMDAPDILDILDYYEEQNQYFEAELCMRLALKLHPHDTEVLVRRAYRMKNEGKWDEAAQFVSRIPEQESVEVQFFLAEKALAELRVEEADQRFQQCLSQEAGAAFDDLEAMNTPSDGSPLLLDIGEICMDYGCVEMAQKYLSRIKPGSPEAARASLDLAECYYQYGETSKALERLDTLLDANPYHLDAWLMKADLCNETHQWSACSEASDFALAIDPRNEKALRLKACAAIGLCEYDKVLEIFSQYRTLYPNDYTMALSAGEILLNKHQYEEAFEVLCVSNRNCPNENPDKMRILTDIAMTYSARHQMKRAFDTLMGIRSLGMSYADVLFHAASQAFSHGEITFGRDAVLHAIEAFGLTPETRLNYARLLCENNLFGTVPELWERLLKDHDMHPVPAAPYLAFAARRLMRIREYKFWLACAIYTDPTLTNAIFRDIYPNVLPQDFLDCAQREFPE
ncbi:MAG: tetratricopeptide repeat protein [Alloprevotella sp.]